MVIYHNLRQ